MGEAVPDISDEQFEEEVLDADRPVIVDMWAPWCGPCRMVTPVIEELAEENGDRVKACKLNVDDNQSTAGKYGITAIPTVLFFKNGEEVQDLRMIGAQSKAEYQEAVNELLEE